MNAPFPESTLDAPQARAAFVAAMQTPAPYAGAHEVSQTVRLVETHVSWVFLTGPFAYKVKKPLRLDFLDYSTAARREHFCHEELRLNQRHAPGLYVDVVGIGGSAQAPRVATADGAFFEHALRMKQFDPSQELAHRLQRDDVTREEIAELTTELAHMHATAQRAAVEATYGRPETVHRFTRDNFDEIARVLVTGAGVPAVDDDERSMSASRALLEDLRPQLEAGFARLRETLERRRLAGFVRECHGDLHCGNVVRWDGRLVAFDGLEFDPALRYIDVASDVAFLTMDLGVNGRPDLRHALLDAWTATSGDYAAVELLPYFEPYRALVRAKVASLRGSQSGEARTESRRAVERYLAWAHGHARPGRPMMLVMAGLSGSGKTWLARRLARACNALHLRSDVERKRLAGLGALEDSRSPPDGGLYTREFGERTYERLRECAGCCLRGGLHVIVDAANLRRHERAAFAQLARDTGAEFKLIHCDAPLDTLRLRVAARRSEDSDASEATVELLDRQPGYWEPLTDDERSMGIQLDTRDADAVERAIRRLRNEAECGGTQ